VPLLQHSAKRVYHQPPKTSTQGALPQERHISGTDHPLKSLFNRGLTARN